MQQENTLSNTTCKHKAALASLIRIRNVCTIYLRKCDSTQSKSLEQLCYFTHTFKSKKTKTNKQKQQQHKTITTKMKKNDAITTKMKKNDFSDINMHYKCPFQTNNIKPNAA
jgi:hypothetical protein